MVVQRPRRNVQKRCDVSAMKFWFDNLILCLFVLPLPFSLFLSPLLVSLRNRTAERRGWRAWQTWQGCYLGVLSWSSLYIIFSGLLQIHLFKGRWSLEKSLFKQNYCHACQRRFAVFFPLPSCCVRSLLSWHDSFLSYCFDIFHFSLEFIMKEE